MVGPLRDSATLRRIQALALDYDTAAVAFIRYEYTVRKSKTECFVVGRRYLPLATRYLRFGFTIASMIAQHHANTAVVAPGRHGVCTANVLGIVNTAYSRLIYDHRYDFSAGAPRYEVHDGFNDCLTPCRHSHGSV